MESKLGAVLTTEFVGTFALIFVGAGAGALGLGGLVGVALAHGLVVAGFAYAYGPISGCHINPAVTLGVWAAGAIAPARALLYVVTQLAGGIAGALALRYCLGGAETGLGATLLARGLEAGGTTISVAPAAGVCVEAILTFFLVNAVLQAAVAGRGGELAGVAIGATLVFAILVGGPLTGASLNPARTLGPAVAAGNFADLWVYLVGPGLGALAAAGLYRGPLAPS
jgi:aquaporin Z